MAIWQYTFELIPKEDLDFIGIDNYVGKMHYDHIHFWRNDQYDIAYFNDITQFLTKGKSWSKDIIIYGNEVSTCMSFVLEDSKVAEVSIRVDFREDYLKLLSQIMTFCISRSLLLLDEEKDILPFNETIINDTIKNSMQYGKLKDFMKG